MEGVPQELNTVMTAGLPDSFPREEMLGYWESHVRGLPDEHLSSVESFVVSQRSWLDDMSVIIDAERARRNPPDPNRWDVV